MGKLVDNYLMQDSIGEGAFGKVYRAFNIFDNHTVAIKVIPKDLFTRNPTLEQYLQNEIQSLHLVKNSNHVIQHVKSFKSHTNFYMVYEYCNGGTLAEFLKNTKPPTEYEVLEIIRQIVVAFQELNKHRVIHRDLKPENIFFHNNRIKLGDFGFSKALMNESPVATTMVGSPVYMAPEVLRGQAYTLKADIWSLGVILYEMLFGFCPFESRSIAGLILCMNNNHLKFPERTEAVTSKTITLLAKMLQKDQFQRVDWNDLFRHFSESPVRPQLLRSVSYSPQTEAQNKDEYLRNSFMTPTKSEVETDKARESYKTDSTSKESKTSFDEELNLSSIFQLNRLLNNLAKQVGSTNPTLDPSVICNNRVCMDAANLAVDIFIDDQKEGPIFYYLILNKVERLFKTYTANDEMSSIVKQQTDLVRSELAKVKGYLSSCGTEVEDILDIKSFLKAKFQQSQRNLSLWFRMSSFLQSPSPNPCSTTPTLNYYSSSHNSIDCYI